MQPACIQLVCPSFGRLRITHRSCFSRGSRNYTAWCVGTEKAEYVLAGNSHSAPNSDVLFTATLEDERSEKEVGGQVTVAGHKINVTMKEKLETLNFASKFGRRSSFNPVAKLLFQQLPSAQ